MENLMKSEWLSIINRKRNRTYPEWTEEPVVFTEDISAKVFDIVDTKDLGGTIFREQGEGQATYFNGDNAHTYSLRFIKSEEFLNQFVRRDPATGEVRNWTKGMSRADYMAYDLSDAKAYFIIHELSTGSIKNKKGDAMNQLLNMVKMLYDSPVCKQYCLKFKKRLCYVSAKNCPTASPCHVADGFMKIYENLPDPLPLQNKSFTTRNFEGFQTNAIKL